MPTPHKHAEVIKAWADGHAIEYRDFSTDDWRTSHYPEWCTDREYRIKPHKWQKEMDAFKAGKTIQYRAHDSGCWFDAPSPSWAPGWEYRIKPETVKFRVFWWKPNSVAKRVVLLLVTKPENDQDDRSTWSGFVAWHGDWQEVEVPSV